MAIYLKLKNILPLASILILAMTLRLAYINWDDGYHFHPDERMIVLTADKLEWVNPLINWQLFSSPESPLNPEFFAYGSFPIYLLAYISYLTSLLLDQPQWSSYSHMQFIGRVISAIADVGTVYLIYMIGRTWLNRRLALWAAFLYSVAVLPIQLSHFYAVDTITTFFITLSITSLIYYQQKLRIKWWILASLAAGLAISSKTSSLLLASIFLFTLSIPFLRLQKPSLKLFQTTLTLILSSVSIIASTIIITQPYLVFDLIEYLRQIAQQSVMAENAWVFPYTRQYLGTIPYLYPLEQIAKWGLGWGIITFSIVGLLVTLVKLPTQLITQTFQNSKTSITFSLILFPLLYFSFFGQSAVKFMRYYLPLYPFLVLFAVVGLQTLAKLMHRYQPSYPSTLMAAFPLLVPTIIWLVGFLSIYTQPNTRIQASQWIASSITPPATFAIEAWDDALPVPPWQQPFGSDFQESLGLYEPDTPQKWQTISQQLSQVDAILIASNRVSAPLTRLPTHYPVASRYYQLLFNGQLGFELAATFSSHPQIGPVTINDQGADESFYVYDHPQIYIFQKIQPQTPQQYYKIITYQTRFQTTLPLPAIHESSLYRFVEFIR